MTFKSGRAQDASADSVVHGPDALCTCLVSLPSPLGFKPRPIGHLHGFASAFPPAPFRFRLHLAIPGLYAAGEIAGGMHGNNRFHNIIPGSAVKSEPFYVAIITPVIHCGAESVVTCGTDDSSGAQLQSRDVRPTQASECVFAAIQGAESVVACTVDDSSVRQPQSRAVQQDHVSGFRSGRGEREFEGQKWTRFLTFKSGRAQDASADSMVHGPDALCTRLVSLPSPLGFKPRPLGPLHKFASAFPPAPFRFRLHLAIPGLYAAGEVAGGMHGNNRFHNIIPGSAVKSEPFYVAIITPVIHWGAESVVACSADDSSGAQLQSREVRPTQASECVFAAIQGAEPVVACTVDDSSIRQSQSRAVQQDHVSGFRSGRGERGFEGQKWTRFLTFKSGRAQDASADSVVHGPDTLCTCLVSLPSPLGFKPRPLGPLGGFASAFPPAPLRFRLRAQLCSNSGHEELSRLAVDNAEEQCLQSVQTIFDPMLDLLTTHSHTPSAQACCDLRKFSQTGIFHVTCALIATAQLQCTIADSEFDYETLVWPAYPSGKLVLR